MRKEIRNRLAAFTLSAAMVFGLAANTGVMNSFAATHLVANESTKSVAITNYSVPMDGAKSSSRHPSGFYAERANVITMVDNSKHINIAYVTDSAIVVKKLNDAMKVESSFNISYRYPLFGDIICDDQGNYYVCWGKKAGDNENIDNIFISKYDVYGRFQYELAVKGYASSPYNSDGFGTKEPFSFGSCDMAYQNGILAVNYARLMYNGHQSNMTLYVETNSMKRLYGTTAYTSHSVDERIYALSDGSFGILTQGDAYNRSFCVAKSGELRESYQYSYNGEMEIDNFHFREGENRGSGYNVTFAQLGGLAEVNGGYVFAAASERTLSLVPTDTSFGGHNEARNVFIQVLKKNFGGYRGAERYAVAGENRAVTGSKPSNAATDLYLQGNEVDQGVIWLTDYSNEYFAANPKVVAVDSDKVAVMWEKRMYNPTNWITWNGTQASVPVSTYMTVLDDKGNVIIDTLQIPNSLLASDTDPVVLNGKIYWATNDILGTNLHCVEPNKYEGMENNVKVSLDKTEAVVRLKETLQLNANYTVSGAKAGITWESSNTDIATVDSKGKVTPVSVGDVEITAKSWVGGVSATCKVKVKPVAPTGLALSMSTLALRVGQTSQLAANVSPVDAGDKTVHWFSSDNSIVSVDKDGVVKGLKAGKAYVIADTNDGWIEANCLVTVTGDGNAYISDAQNVSVAMHRLYNPNSGEHFYTASDGERDYLTKAGWNSEGDAWKAPTWSYKPVYRVYNPNAGDHHYTLMKGEVDNLVKSGWNYEGIAWYSDTNEKTPLYRLYNPNATTGAHHFTSIVGEKNYLISIGWRDEQIGWYGR